MSENLNKKPFVSNDSNKKPFFSKDSNKKQIISKDKLLEAGVYFGHKPDRWNPKMKPYIATTKKGTHILDVDKTKRTLEFAYSLIHNFAKKGASFVFVGTRKQAKEAVKSNALRTNSYYVSERWLGGTLTNSRTIFQRVKRMEMLERSAEKNYDGYTKKEGVLFAKELAKLQKNLSGIRRMTYKPNIMIVADPKADDIAVKEARKLGVKVIGLVDTNNDPQSVDIAIPANDDSVKSVTLILTLLADAIAEAKGGTTLFAYKSDSEIILPDEPKRERPQRRGFRRNFNRTERPAFKTRSSNSRPTSTKPSYTKPATTKPVVKTETVKTVEAPKVEAKVSSDFSAMKVDELKTALKNKGLPVSGKKSELIERLQGA